MSRLPALSLLLALAAACQSDQGDVPPIDETLGEPAAGSDDLVRTGTLAGAASLPTRAPTEPLVAAGAPGGGADCTGTGYDAWRSWTPRHNGAPRTLVQPAAGYLDGAIVVQGGRASVTTLNNVSGMTFVLPTPTCAAPAPDFAAVSIVSGVGPKVWGAASTVAARRLWVIGGTTSGAGACVRTTAYFEFTAADRSAGRWVQIASLLPQGLCQATATTLLDAGGKEWIVLAGGSTRSLPNTSCAGGFAPTGPTLVLDPSAAAPVWVAQTGLVDDRARWGGAIAPAADGKSAFVFGGSSSTTIAGGPTADGSRLTIDVGNKLGFAAASDLPAPSFAAAAASWSSGGLVRVYVSGGASTLGPASGCTGSSSGNLPGSSAMWSFDPATGNFGAVASSPARRVGHALVAVPAFDQVKLYAIGGADGTTAAWTVDEYTP